MKRILAASLIGLLTWPQVSFAQAVQATPAGATVISACNGATIYTVGTTPPMTQDPKGNACSSASGGGGGGGPVTIADGADITQGAIADLAWTSGTGTLVALNKAIDRDVLLLNAKFPVLGQTTKTGSVSVAIASDQTVPVSGTFFQATQPVSGAAGSFVDGALVTLGAQADAACATDNGTCTAEALFKRGNQRLTTINTTLGTPFQAGGSIGNLFALDTTLATTNTNLGAPGSTACASDTASCSLNQYAQRLAQRLTTINTTLGSPLQAGGTVVVTQTTASNLNAQVVGAIASGSANGGFPVKIGGATVTAAQTFSTGNVSDLLIGAKGGVLVTPMFSTAAASFAGLPITTYDVGGNSRLPATGPYVYDGTAEQVQLSVVTGTNSTGTGIAAAGLVGQFDDVSPLACTENQFCNLRMSTNRNLYGTIRDAAGNERGLNVDSHNSGQFVQYDSSGNPIDYTQNINVAPGPGGRVDVSCSTGNVANATSTCTMPATTGKTTYVTGFDITGSGATVGAAVTCTLTNTNSGTISYTYVITAGALLVNTPLIRSFAPPLKGTAANTAPVLSCPAGGTGNTNMTLNAYGYEL